MRWCKWRHVHPTLQQINSTLLTHKGRVVFRHSDFILYLYNCMHWADCGIYLATDVGQLSWYRVCWLLVFKFRRAGCTFLGHLGTRYFRHLYISKIHKVTIIARPIRLLNLHKYTSRILLIVIIGAEKPRLRENESQARSGLWPLGLLPWAFVAAPALVW